MEMKFENLDPKTRRLMLQELEADQKASNLYLSERLNSEGEQQYPRLLKEALVNHDADWLAEQLGTTLFNHQETRRNSDGSVTNASLPKTANVTLAEGEFNRYYMRAVCLRAIDSVSGKVEFYRAKEVKEPRPNSEAMIGEKRDANQLLTELRTSAGARTDDDFPAANSGLSVRLIV